MNNRLIVAIIGVKDAQLPELRHLKSPVTIKHTLWKCERCGGDAWIGPKQRLLVTLSGHEAVCYRCIFEDPNFRDQEEIPMLGLNFEIEEAPRRWQ